MAPQDPSCKALAAAKDRKGMSYGQIAAQIGQSEQHVIDVCTGTTKPTQAEFDAIAKVLGVSNAPHTAAHATV